MRKIRLDIGGPKGNAFYILASVDNLTSGDRERTKEIRDKMTSGDYDNLLRVFKEEFPFVELYAQYELSNVDKSLYVINNDTIEL